MRYHHEHKLFSKLRRWRRSHKFFFASLWMLGVLVAVGIIFMLYQNSKQSLPNQSDTVTETFSGARNKTIANQYFHFTSSVLWELDPESSDIPRKFVYLNKKKSLIERVLTLYLDSAPNELKVTYILPVTVQGDAIVHKQLSSHCGDSRKRQGNPFTATYEGITYTCVPDLNDMIIAAGSVGGSYPIVLQDGSQQSHKLIAVYQDTTVERKPLLFGELIDTFKLR